MLAEWRPLVSPVISDYYMREYKNEYGADDVYNCTMQFTAIADNECITLTFATGADGRASCLNIFIEHPDVIAPETWDAFFTTGSVVNLCYANGRTVMIYRDGDKFHADIYTSGYNDGCVLEYTCDWELVTGKLRAAVDAYNATMMNDDIVID